MKKFSIILVNYNNYDDSKDILNNLYTQNLRPEEIILVDNCSTDESFKKLSCDFNSYNGLSIIQSDFNGGFSYANNYGIKYSLKKSNEIDFYILLNNDTYVDPNFLDICSNSVRESNDIGIFTGKILNYFHKDRIWYGGGHINKIYFSGLHDYENHNSEIPEANILKNVEFASGCFMIIPKKIFIDGHFLPEEYFLYYEDVDYSLLMTKLKLKIEYNPKMIVYHKISRTTNSNNLRFNYYFNRNRIILGRKYFSVIRVIYFVSLLIVSRIILYFKNLVLNKKSVNVFSGILSGLRYKIEK